MDALSRCTRYAFAPNRLHLCGPDKSSEIYAYLSEGETDKGLEILLSQFKTMYPYLRQIAHSNKINDPLDKKVVDAYWIGNSLLENVLPRQFWRNAVEDHMFHKRFDTKSFGSWNQNRTKCLNAPFFPCFKHNETDRLFRKRTHH